MVQTKHYKTSVESAMRLSHETEPWEQADAWQNPQKVDICLRENRLIWREVLLLLY